MDWKYKHFNQEAVFNASRQSVLEAARLSVVESLGGIEDTADGFVARGYSAYHPAIATFHITPTPEATRVAVELLVERAAMRGYMLFDVGGYYNGQIDKWFSGMAKRLGATREQILDRKTTSNAKVRQGRLAGCLVFLVVGAGLGFFTILLERVLFPRSSGWIAEMISIVASVIGLLAGVLAYRYVVYPDSSEAKFIRERVLRTRNKERE